MSSKYKKPHTNGNGATYAPADKTQELVASELDVVCRERIALLERYAQAQLDIVKTQGNLESLQSRAKNLLEDVINITARMRELQNNQEVTKTDAS